MTLGNPNGAAALRRAGKGAVALRAAVTANADTFAADLAPVLETIRSEGHTTLRALASELNRQGIQTRRGGSWHVSTVRNLIARLGSRHAAVRKVWRETLGDLFLSACGNALSFSGSPQRFRCRRRTWISNSCC
ncbi:hypothetical protein QO034_19555 [Sedimentitalea sp. JM2-8]|uniref:Recombinase-like domain-containing protein n=1 Tax=Sedimentitalea xiamensis TaxID=3050037 RepID=A0ABT7FJK9_9RHOB|nr:recombinase-like helix-turn-helix domain-containing protein [Sedimentitalea xiamensis]MDK3075282.1 hypothetical protein [Sedimentitalea xiamensis]